MPAHVFDRRGSIGHKKSAFVVKCRTCPNPLTPYDAKDGCKRCRDCRKASPGRQIVVGEGPGYRSATPNAQTVKAAPIVDPQATSFWLNVPRDQWGGAVQAHVFRGVRKTLPLNHGVGFSDGL